tara:strand:- start:4053 stop:4361 length:309 start_codon:yes stop_codon:yes gene_type:complete
MINMSNNISKNRSILTKFAKKIVDRGMSVPAIFFLEMIKYMSFIASQFMIFMGPVITSFLRSEPYYNMANLLEDKKNVEFLMIEIERLEARIKNNKRTNSNA